MTRPPCICCHYFRDRPAPRCLADAPEAIGHALLAESVWPCSMFNDIEAADPEQEGDSDG